MQKISRIVLTALLLMGSYAAITGQELKRFSKDGATFEYTDGWEPVDQSQPDIQQISIANEAADSQIRILILRKRSNSKDAMAELKRTVVDPWLRQLVGGYNYAGLKFEQTPANTEVAGTAAEGTAFKFQLDGQAGGSYVFWTLLDKRLVILYFIRPEKKAEQATPGWDAIRKSLRVEKVKD